MSQNNTNESALADLIDKQAISQLIACFGNSIDRKAWDELGSCLAPELFNDIRGVSGATPENLTREKYVAMRSRMLASLSTHHMLGNIEISVGGFEANARASSVIYRYDSEGRVYNTHCQYEFGLIKTADRWTINAIIQNVLWNAGSTDVYSGLSTGEAGY